jgi:hypothetical protein
MSAAVLTAAAFALLSAVALAAMSGSPQRQLRSLVGSWTCINSGAMMGGREHDVNTMYGSWLKTDATYSGGATGVTYIGYDTKSHHFVLLNADEHGGYGVASGSGASLDGSSWRDVYPADGGTGVLHITDANHYSFNGMFPNGHGKMAAARASCSRSS